MELLRRIGVGTVMIVGFLLPHDVAIAQDLTGTIGPLVAGVLVATVGAGWAVVFDGLTFAASAALLLRLRLPDRVEREERQGLVAEVRDGWRAVTTRSQRRTLLLPRVEQLIDAVQLTLHRDRTHVDIRVERITDPLLRPAWRYFSTGSSR